jgi:predicted RNA-binding protein YlqC (UPF0109 family)
VAGMRGDNGGGEGRGGSMFEEPDFSRAPSPGAAGGGAGTYEDGSPVDQAGLTGEDAGEIDLDDDEDELGDEDDLDDDFDDAANGEIGSFEGDDGEDEADEGDDGDLSAEMEAAGDFENRLVGGAARAVLEHVARTLVEDPNSIVVETTEGRSGLRFAVRVAQSDMGRLIGRRGRTAQALRTLVRAAAASEGTDASVDIVD